MIDIVIQLVWKLTELVITIAVAWWLINIFIDVPKLFKAMKGGEPYKKTKGGYVLEVRKGHVAYAPAPKRRVEMVRKPDGHFAYKAPPKGDAPYTDEELAEAEEEIERDLKRRR